MKLGVISDPARDGHLLKRKTDIALDLYILYVLLSLTFCHDLTCLFFVLFPTVVVSYKLFMCLRSSNSISEQCVFSHLVFRLLLSSFCSTQKNSLNHREPLFLLGFLAGIQAKKTKKASPVVTWRSRVGAFFFGGEESPNTRWGCPTSFKCGYNPKWMAL